MQVKVHQRARLSSLEQAILHAVAYGDVFDYPLTSAEILRYLLAVPASLEQVQAALDGNRPVQGYLERVDGYYCLAGRGHLAAVRGERRETARRLWPWARHFGRLLSRLPYLRMAAVSGALAMDNEPGVDIDFLLVTEPGRLWLCRGLAMLLVRWARRSGVELCPNYLVTTRALHFPGRDLYTAHEILQMVPLHGLEVYWYIRKLNGWADELFPNAASLPRPEIPALEDAPRPLLQRVGEALLSTPPGDWLEGWERQRKARKLNAQRAPGDEADFSGDWCKGHFGGYGGRSMAAYALRMETLRKNGSGL